MIMQYTRSQILENRRTSIMFLLDPKRKKAKESLDKGGGRRCCLGHMCYAMSIRRNSGSLFSSYNYGNSDESMNAPEELVAMLGMWDEASTSDAPNSLSIDNFIKENSIKMDGYTTMRSLIALNDYTNATPQQIGAYLQSVIEGGKDTPFRPLSDYPETLEGNNP